MKTDDLIKVLAADDAPKDNVASRIMRALPLALALSAAAFFAGMGLRENMSQPDVARAVLTKLAMTLPLAVAGFACAWRAIQPGTLPGARVWLFLLPLAVLGAALALDMQRNGLEQFWPRLFGQNYWRCLIAIPLFSLAPLAALLHAFRAGAAIAPDRAGALAGLAAAGLGASLYALHCTDDSPLFVLAWYSLASAITAGLGAIVGRRLLAW